MERLKNGEVHIRWIIKQVKLYKALWSKDLITGIKKSKIVAFFFCFFNMIQQKRKKTASFIPGKDKKENKTFAFFSILTKKKIHLQKCVILS